MNCNIRDSRVNWIIKVARTLTFQVEMIVININLGTYVHRSTCLAHQNSRQCLGVREILFY